MPQHILDQLPTSTTGHSYPLLRPFTTYHLSAGDLYQSSDWLPAMIAAGLAVAAISPGAVKN